jgi:hypothetical protein
VKLQGSTKGRLSGYWLGFSGEFEKGQGVVEKDAAKNLQKEMRNKLKDMVWRKEGLVTRDDATRFGILLFAS